MATIGKYLLWIAAVGMIVVGGLGVGGVPVSEYAGQATDWVWAWVQPSVSKPTVAVIVYESNNPAPLPQNMVELYALAPSLGVSLWDKDIEGKGKKPSAQAKPFIDAAGKDGLPKLVVKWSNGKRTVKSCNGWTVDDLKKAIGKP